MLRAAARALRYGQSPPHRLRARIYGAPGATVLNHLTFGSRKLPTPLTRTTVFVNFVNEFGFGSHGWTSYGLSIATLTLNTSLPASSVTRTDQVARLQKGPSPPSNSLAVN